MISWILVKTTSAKLWSWLKHNWQIPGLLIWTVFIYIFASKNTIALKEVIKIKKDSHRREVEALNKAHNKEVLELRGLQDEYMRTIAKLKQEFALRKTQLNERQEDDIRRVVVESKGDPARIKKRIEDEFGIVFKN